MTYCVPNNKFLLEFTFSLLLFSNMFCHDGLLMALQTAVETNSCRHATKKNNLEKNQNQKTIPYDYNRVVLDKIHGISDSDYVNASYCDVNNV